MGKVKHGEAREQLMPIRPGTGASHQTQLQVEQVPALSILRTDTVFAKLPIHTLSRSGPIRIQINQTNAQGVQELYWSVSPSSVYGPPQLLAYKLDTLVINRHLDGLKRPLPPLICLGSLRQICQELGLSTGKSTVDLKRAFHQNAGVYITAKLRYRDVEGNVRRLEAGFNRYGVVFTGESLPGGSAADAVYITLHESYREVLNSAPTRPVDYDYLTCLKPLAQRFYELLSFKMFAALKHQHRQVSVRYSELCLYGPQYRYSDGVRMSKQMYKVHQPHLQSGYLADVTTRRVRDDQGRPDWLLQYTPGPRARAEFQAFTGQKRPGGQALRTEGETGEARPPGAGSDGPQLPERPPVDIVTAQATTLVGQFHQQFHERDDIAPHPREIACATELIERQGWAFAQFFVDFACNTARRRSFAAEVFGGLKRYEAEALAAYRRQRAKEARERAEAARLHQTRLEQQYEHERLGRIEAYRARLPRGDLEALRAQVYRELTAAETIPSCALKLRVQVELDEQLASQAGMPTFEDWRREREAVHG
jgi:hypothetical protein